MASSERSTHSKPLGESVPIPTNIADHTRLLAPEVYEIIRVEGEEELRRPFQSLLWSGIAAGLAICASIQAKAFLHSALPDTSWRPLLSNLGYTVGFLIVVLGRLQLFTENTITAILPLLRRRTSRMLYSTARLWAVVFFANILGTFTFAALSVWAGIASEEHLAAFIEISEELLHKTPLESLATGAPAGFLVAAVVWMLPSADGSKALIIIILTYLIGLGHFSHVVVGSGELWLLLLTGHASILEVLGHLFATLVGNILGGTGLFALTAYAQVSEEL